MSKSTGWPFLMMMISSTVRLVAARTVYDIRSGVPTRMVPPSTRTTGLVDGLLEPPVSRATGTPWLSSHAATGAKSVRV